MRFVGVEKLRNNSWLQKWDVLKTRETFRDRNTRERHRLQSKFWQTTLSEMNEGLSVSRGAGRSPRRDASSCSQDELDQVYRSIRRIESTRKRGLIFDQRHTLLCSTNVYRFCLDARYSRCSALGQTRGSVRYDNRGEFAIRLENYSPRLRTRM